LGEVARDRVAVMLKENTGIASMKFILRKLRFLIVVLLLLVIGGAALGVWLIDSIARKGIEKGSTYALGVPTTLGSANVGILSGTFGLSKLNVGNPQGFAAPHFLSLGEGGVQVSLNTLRQSTVELPVLSLSNLDVSLERKGDSSNYKVILDNLAKLQSGSGSKPASKDDTRFVIRELSLKNIKVHLDLVGGPGFVNELTKIDIPIDEIKLKDVGKTGTGVAGTGVTMGELASIIVQAVLGAAAEKGGGLIPDDLLGDLKGKLAGLNGVKDLGMKVLGDAKGSIEQAGKKVVDDVTKEGKKAVEGVLDKGLKNLLPGKDKK
jgi:hypothetical protein